jgi:hypothetical protein
MFQEGKMEKKILKVGLNSGDLTGTTNLVIQAAIDYMYFIGGGTVSLGEGTFNIDSAVHLRSNVTLEGTPGKTILKKGKEVMSPVLADADLHENKVTVKDPQLFAPGQTVVVKYPDHATGFNDTVAVVTGREGVSYRP